MKHQRILQWLAAFLAVCLAVTCMPLSAAAAETVDRVVKVGIIRLEGYAMENGDGSIVGINAEYAYKIAQYANLEIEIVLFDQGTEALTALDHGEIDMMCNVIKTGDREEKYLFSENAVGSLAMCVFVGEDSDRFTYGNTAQLKNMKFGVESGSKVKDAFTEWCAQHDIEPSLQEYPTLKDIEAALQAGRIDAGLYGAPSVEGYRTVQLFSPVPYYFVFRKSDSVLKNQVDDAMGGILNEDPMYFDRLKQKYTASSEYKMEALTAEEKTFLTDNQTLKVAVLENDEPYYCTARKGKPSGILPDYFQKITELTGMQFTYTAYATQEEAVEAVKAGQADILGMYSDGQISAYHSGLRITHAYADVDIVLLTRSGTGMEEVKSCAVKNRSLRTIRSGTDRLLHTEYTGYDSVSACFAALKSGKTDGMLCGLPTATWFANQNLSSTYDIITLSSDAIELCAATAYSAQTLCSILSKAIAASAYSFSETVASNTQAEDSLETMISRIPPMRIAILTAVLVILVVGLVWMLITLRRHQKEKEDILAKSTENDRKEAEIIALEKAAEEKNAFFSNISHDMRTPLNAILGFSRLCEQEEDPAVLRDYNAKIRLSGELLLGLINDTLTISKANSGKLQLHPAPVNVKELFQSIIVPIREEARKKNIVLIADDSAAQERTVLADALSVQKIFLNLLSNAVKYTPDDGYIHFRMYDEPTEKDGPDTVCVVSDNGIGISEEFMPHLFEPFSQEKRPGYEAVGTGLGLSIVKQLVDLMGGSIAVQSEKGKGTVFTVRLHFTEIKADETAGRKAEPADMDFTGRKVLMCEDNALNREIAAALLRAKGMTVVSAENGKLGVQKFRDSAGGEFDAVLMDVRMPVMNGIEAARAIRALKRADAGTIPIIAMTADAFEDDVRKCRDAGMDGHIAKPIDPALLYAMLRRKMQPAGVKHPGEAAETIKGKADEAEGGIRKDEPV